LDLAAACVIIAIIVPHQLFIALCLCSFSSLLSALLCQLLAYPKVVVLRKPYVCSFFFFLEHAGELRTFILRRRKAQNRQVQTAKGGNTDTGILHET
jgi:hypothetical protein